MKKINNKGFVLAETLVVTVFLMAIFLLVYRNFLPLVGEYEKRETYDDVDSKYAVYWLKRMIEDSSYSIPVGSDVEKNFQQRGYVRFECSNVSEENEKREECINLVKALQVNGCDKNGNQCDIFITKFRIGYSGAGVWFKNTVLKGKNMGTAENPNWASYKKYEENCFNTPAATCKQNFINKCLNGVGSSTSLTTQNCTDLAEKNLFSSGFKDYIIASPDYSAGSVNNAKYRVIAIFHNKKDNNNYYSYAAIEVDR